jgi:PST family polysaccharide transporter
MRSLTKVSASGFAWLLAQSGGARIVGVLSQILLARLLRPEDFGDVALATSVTSVIGVLIGFGIDDVLLSRARKFRFWVVPAILIGFSFSLVGAAALLAAAPITARVYRSDTVFGLLGILALGLPVGALGTVPNAFLRSQLKFRFLATYGIVELTACQVATILLAWRGFGAYSFVIPSPFAALVRAIVLWRVARPPLRGRVRRRQFSLLLRCGSAVFGTKLVTALRQNGDYLLLGAFASNASVGLYFLAFKLAAAPVYMLASSMSGVLFPALAQLRGEPWRQRCAVLSASRAVALAVIPLSVLEAAVARPFVRSFFGEKWVAAAPMLSILSLGLAFDVVPCVAGALIGANGNFKALWRWSLASIPIFFSLIGIGCFAHGAEGVAVGVAVFFAIGGPSFSFFAMRPLGCSARDVLAIYAPPTLCAAAATGLALLLARVLPLEGWDILAAFLVSVVSLLGYIIFVRWLSPAAARDTMRKFSLILSHAT